MVKMYENVGMALSRDHGIISHGAFLGNFRFVGLYKKVLYTTV